MAPVLCLRVCLMLPRMLPLGVAAGPPGWPPTPTSMHLRTQACSDPLPLLMLDRVSGPPAMCPTAALSGGSSR